MATRTEMETKEMVTVMPAETKMLVSNAIC